jgi:hypothetical protein
LERHAAASQRPVGTELNSAMPTPSGNPNHPVSRNPEKVHGLTIGDVISPFADPMTITALRADNYSPDGKNVIISMATKYSNAERRYSVPVEWLHDFLLDLRRLSPVRDTASIGTSISQ